MRPVNQTIFHDDPYGRPGNCYQACLATLFDLDLCMVPHFMQIAEERKENWVDHAQDWLGNRGYRLLTLNIAAAPRGNVPESEDNFVLCIGAGPSPRNKHIQHAVVGKLSVNRCFVILHDPHPSNAGCLEYTEVDVFLPKDVSKVHSL